MQSLLAGAAVLLSLMTAGGALAPVISEADIVNHFRPYTLAGTAGLLLVALALQMPAIMRCSASLTAINVLLLLLPLLWSAETSRGQAFAVGASGYRDLKIVSFNIAWAKRPIDNVAEFLLQEDADIVLLQEITDAHASALRPLLKDRYPHSYACAVFQGCTQAIFSKRPWASVTHVYRATGNPEMITALFDDPALGRFRVHSLHLAWPFTPHTQARHIDRLIALCTATTEPTILAGDFNLTPWSYQLQRLLAAARLRRHATFLRSWPTDGQFRLALPIFLIDHVLTTADFKTLSIHAGPSLGSDHLPIVARLRLVRS